MSRKYDWLLGGTLALALVAAALAYKYVSAASDNGASSTAATLTKAPAIPVSVAKVRQHDVPIIVEGLGIVQPLQTAIIRTQVQGTLDSVDFVEGQEVKRGQVLAQIDPRVYQAQVMQAEAALARDKAQVKNAEADLGRSQPLLDKGFATRQQVDTQKSQVSQNLATVQLDEAALQGAQTQLSFATIKAPFDGITGIRRIDPGNIVQPSDANGLVTVTQIQPIAVVFTLPSSDILRVQKAIAAGTVAVEAYDANNQTRLDGGTLMLIDNQVDSATGTVRLKASFPNADRTLWPGVFVNIHLTVATESNGLTVPLTAVLQGPKGPFVYLVGAGNTVSIKTVQTGQSRSGQVIVTSGLSANDTVVSGGQYRLKDGTAITVPPASQQDTIQNSSTGSAGMLP